VRALGWQPDPPKLAGDKPDWDALELLGAAPPPYRAAAFELVLSVLQQQSLGSCTTNAAGQVLRGAMVRAGLPPYLVSRMFLYWLARKTHSNHRLDTGTWNRAVFEVAAKFGLPAEHFWPYLFDELEDGDGVKRPRWACAPNSEAIQAGFDTRAKVGLQYRKIQSIGYERVEAVKRAVADRRLVQVGSTISEAWFDHNGLHPLDPPTRQNVAGGHAYTVCAYEGDVFTIVNSWGTGWGSGGYGRITADVLADGSASDFWVAHLEAA
jgi:hypothetical protein